MATSETPKSSGSNIYIKETYSAAELKSDMAKLHHNFDIENLENGYSDGVVKKLSTQFNRFKMAFPDEELTYEEQKVFLLDFAKMLILEKGEKRAISLLKGIAPKFFVNLPNSKQIRIKLSQEMNSYDDLIKIIS